MKKRRRIIISNQIIGLIILLGTGISLKGQSIHKKFWRTQIDSVWIENLLKKHPGDFGRILADPQKLEVQILYTQINRDKNNQPHFKRFSYHLNPHDYFYPASTVKLPLTALALKKIQDYKLPNLEPGTVLQIDSAAEREIQEFQDSSSYNHEPSIAQFIRKIFLVSDNDAFNRLYEFLGPDYINKTLHNQGFSSVKIIHRLSVNDDPIHAAILNPMYFLHGFDTLLKIPLRKVKIQNNPYFSNTLKGKGYIEYHGKDSSLISKPFDFSNKNGISLEDEQNILIAILFPSYASTPDFQLNPENRKFLLKYMSMKPKESIHPYYPVLKYPDNYGKYILYGSDSAIQIPKNIRIFNKIGQAYGYLIDNAYVVDFDKKVEFLVSAVINTNTDQIYNDDQYEYTQIGFPFFRNLGKYLYEFELERKRVFKPNLGEFLMDYSKPDSKPFNP